MFLWSSTAPMSGGVMAGYGDPRRAVSAGDPSGSVCCVGSGSAGPRRCQDCSTRTRRCSPRDRLLLGERVHEDGTSSSRPRRVDLLFVEQAERQSIVSSVPAVGNYPRAGRAPAAGARREGVEQVAALAKSVVILPSRKRDASDGRERDSAMMSAYSASPWPPPRGPGGSSPRTHADGALARGFSPLERPLPQETLWRRNTSGRSDSRSPSSL